MAQQWVAGTVSGQVLTAATLNTIGAAWESYTPTLTQGVTVTKTIQSAKYCQIQKLVIVNVALNVTSAGTSNVGIIVGLPKNVLSTDGSYGAGFVYDASGNALYHSTVNGQSSSTVQFLYQTGSPVGQSPTFALASGDIIRFTIAYEVA
jgi:hypothetical protein